MKIYKFGGASLKTSKAVKNMITIVCEEQERPLIIIVSAMGKSTNMLEAIWDSKIKDEDFLANLNFFKKYHLEICHELFPDSSDEIYTKLNHLFELFDKTIDVTGGNSDFEESYDAIVSFGELMSSLIVSRYFNTLDVACHLLDARQVIKTDDSFKESKILWEETDKKIKDVIGKIDSQSIVLSQGFIGSTMDGRTTTLGREGSDFTAAIFASCLGASGVTFWKDVPGIMNADPKLIGDAVLLDHLPYQEAAEMTYYGAKVIHPKTIRPLANKNIPLYVKGFDHPDLPGTSIKEYDSWEKIPVIIYKKDQYLISCKFIDFSFVNEESLVKIFDILHELDIKVNMMQNSAISFSICIDRHPRKTDELLERLSAHFLIHYNSELTLVTIKNFTQEALDKYRPVQNVMLEQQTRANYRAVIKDEN